MAFGLATEVIQPFFYRGGRMLDVMINWSGVILCVLVYVCIRQSMFVVESIKERKLAAKV
jgi:glycopeptide antibiotics resistance protein